MSWKLGVAIKSIWNTSCLPWKVDCNPVNWTVTRNKKIHLFDTRHQWLSEKTNWLDTRDPHDRKHNHINNSLIRPKYPEYDKWHRKSCPYVERSMLTSSALTYSVRPVQGLLGENVLLWHAVQSFADMLILSCHWSYSGSRALLWFHHACQTGITALANLSEVIILYSRDWAAVLALHVQTCILLCYHLVGCGTMALLFLSIRLSESNKSQLQNESQGVSWTDPAMEPFKTRQKY